MHMTALLWPGGTVPGRQALCGVHALPSWSPAQGCSPEFVDNPAAEMRPNSKCGQPQMPPTITWVCASTAKIPTVLHYLLAFPPLRPGSGFALLCRNALNHPIGMRIIINGIVFEKFFFLLNS